MCLQDVVRQFNVTAEEEGGDCLLTTFIRVLQELLVETPLEPHSYHLHAETTRVLVVLLSSVLYSPGKPTHQLAAWREMMRSPLTIPLTCCLLQRYIDQTSPPALQESQGSIVLGLASSVWSILTLGELSLPVPALTRSHHNFALQATAVLRQRRRQRRPWLTSVSP